MEVKEASAKYLRATGYKQTEVGVIPEDWEIHAVHQFSTIKTGPFGTLLKASEYSEGDGVPLISVGEIRQGFLRITDATPRVSEAITRRLPQYVLRKGDIVFGRKGGVERSALIRREHDGWFLGSDGLSIRPTQDCHDLYLAYQFQSARVKGWLIQNAIGTTMPSLNQAVLRNVVIPLPPTKAEQEAIAEALSDADALIESLEQLLAKKRHLKQGAMQELLTGKKSLPGFSGSSKFKQTEIGLFPEDWTLIRLVDLVDPARSIRYGIVQPGDYDPQGRYMVRGQDYSEVKGWANPTEVFRVSPGIEERYRNARVKTGDLIMTIVGYCGHVEMIPEWLDGANLTQTTARIAIKPDMAVNAFCKYMLMSPTGKNQVAAYIKGAAQPGLNCGDVEKFLLPLPSLPEQAAIATILSDMDAELAALEEKLAKARAIKQGMMQELLTGRIRLV